MRVLQLAVTQKYLTDASARYLFSLPKDLMLKSQEEDWPAVIAGYERAKTAKTQTSITVFAEILEVIESIIETVSRFLPSCSQLLGDIRIW